MSETDLHSAAVSANEPAASERPRASALGDRVRSLRLPNSTPGSSLAGYLPWALCVLLAAGVAYFALRPQGEKGSAESPQTANPESAAPALGANPAPSTANGASPVAATGGNVALAYKGNIIAARQILVSPQVSGVIVSLKISEGDRVAKDSVIAELETTDFEADRSRAAAMVARARSSQLRAEATLQRARAREREAERGFREQEVEQAQAELDEAKTQLVQTDSEFQRTKRLQERGAVSPHEFELAQSKYEAAQYRVKRLEFARDLMKLGERDERKEMARFEVKQAEADVADAAAGLSESEADLAKAVWRLDNCTIRAPVSGTILRKNAEEGNLVNPVAQQGSYSLCEMADLSDLEVELKIQERDISRVFKGQRCKVIADAFREREYEGIVSRLMPIADRAKAAIPVRVKVKVPAEEEGVYLKPEMGAEVTFFNDSPAAP